MQKHTLFEKVWDEHVVCVPDGRLPLLYIDLHLVHEVTSPQAFDGLRAANRRVRQPQRTIATVDHNIPTTPRGTPITDPIALRQIDAPWRTQRRMKMGERSGRRAPHGAEGSGLFDPLPRPADGAYLFSEQSEPLFEILLMFLPELRIARGAVYLAAFVPPLVDFHARPLVMGADLHLTWRHNKEILSDHSTK